MAESADEVVAREPFWKNLIGSFTGQFKNECNIQSYELGIEMSLATYLITKYIVKKPQYTFRCTLLALGTVPLIWWPICTVQKKADLVPKEL